MARRWVTLGALVALVGVAAGAFGAHALSTRLGERELRTFETSARYQLIHAIALVLVGALADRDGFDRRWLHASGSAFFAGIVLFCGSLYPLALGGPRILGAITPFGGLAFMLGWGALAWSARARVPTGG